MIFSCFASALGQFDDPRFRRVILLGIFLTIALLAGFTFGFVSFVGWITPDSVSTSFGEITWLPNLVGWGSAVLMLALSTFLMVPVASLITSMFLDRVAQAVEDRHYPNLPAANSVPFTEALRDTLSFLGVLIAANLIALIAYLILNIAAPLVFWALNGYLLSREYFTLVAMRRIGRIEAKRMRARHSGTIWLAGILMAMPLSIPLLNLVIPVLGVATFTHLFHQLQRADPYG